MTKRFAVMTQDECPNCERLKIMLSKPLKGKFNDEIDFVHRVHQEAEFNELTQAHDIRVTPVIIDRNSGKVLTNTAGIGEVSKFLGGQ